MITVIKRDGRIEPLNVAKIQKHTHDAVLGLDGTSQSELEVDARLHFRDKMPTTEIQATLIKTAVDKIDLDRPNWTFVAARLFLYDLYHRVCGRNSYYHLRDYLENGEEEGRIARGFKEKYDLDRLNRKIDPKRDLQFTYLGIKTLHDRYLLKNRNGEPIELPQHMFMAVAMFLAQNEKDPNFWAEQFYDILSKFEVMAATPTLSNARTSRHQLSSCYVGSCADNIEGIFDSYKEMALLSKYGGGIGWDFSKIRGLGSFIDGHKNAAGGVIPFLKITNDIAIAVDQLGTRKGAIAVYIEPWHSDIFDFVDIKKNSGEERRRAHDLFPALWICDLFMKRIAADEDWSLFDPLNCSDLCDLYGADFEKRYKEYEADKSIPRQVVRAKELWKKILTSYFEIGSPFLCFKDNANAANPNSHAGLIRSSNLCTEIFQNTEPNTYYIKVEFEDGSISEFEENDIVKNDLGIEKKANKITSTDKIGGKQVFIANRERRDGASAVCNLASINLSKINTKEDIERVVPVAVRMLDNVIDLNFYPNRKVKATNLTTRAIGLGVMGEAQMLAQAHIHWGSEEHLKKIDEIMEMISFNTIRASAALGQEKGVYKNFKGSSWEKGIMPFERANLEAQKLVDRGLFEQIYNWEDARVAARAGMRNGYLMAIAPTSSISILVGTTQTIEPIYKRKWFEENLSGLIPVVAPALDLDNWNYYAPAYEVDQMSIIKAAAVRQKWIDQGQSVNIFMRVDGVSGKYLHDLYSTAWRLGLKSTYYLRSQSVEAEKKTSQAQSSQNAQNNFANGFNNSQVNPMAMGGDVINRAIECEGCQ